MATGEDIPRPRTSISTGQAQVQETRKGSPYIKCRNIVVEICRGIPLRVPWGGRGGVAKHEDAPTPPQDRGKPSPYYTRDWHSDFIVV